MDPDEFDRRMDARRANRRAPTPLSVRLAEVGAGLFCVAVIAYLVIDWLA